MEFACTPVTIWSQRAVGPGPSEERYYLVSSSRKFFVTYIRVSVGKSYLTCQHPNYWQQVLESPTNSRRMLSGAGIKGREAA
jgi:hypothetical protein